MGHFNVAKKKYRLCKPRPSKKLAARSRYQRKQAQSQSLQSPLRSDCTAGASTLLPAVESNPAIEEASQEMSHSLQSGSESSDRIPEKVVASEARYIVNVAYMLEQLHEKFDDHNPLAACSFRDVVQTNSRRHGLQTQLFFQCRVCEYEGSIWTDRKDGEAMDINRSAVAGTIATGIGFSQLEELLAAMSIPCMSPTTYSKYNLEMIAAFEKAARTEMEQAAAFARERALERGDFIIHDGMKIPFVTVVADCGWMKRSYKSGKYDSLSGVGTIVDQESKRVLFIGVRNKFCSICEKATRNDVTPNDHVCFKNWGRDQASTAMESDALLEGFKTSIETHGLIYKTLVGDGDSNVFKTILDNDPYSKYGVVVEKKECVNHLLRNLSRKIRDVAKTKGRKISVLKKLVGGSVLKFRTAIEKAVRHHQGNRSDNPPGASPTDLLKNDVLSTPYHVFGDHSKCDQVNGFCCQESTDEGINTVADLKKAGLFQQLEDAITYLSFHADSLMYHATNNIAESFNSIVCKLIGGKRINFGQRGSFQGRCAGSVLQHNTLNILTKLHQSEDKLPPSTTTTLEARRQHKARKNAEIRRRQKASKAVSRNDNRPQRGLDKNYGPNAQRPDLPSGAYDDLQHLHLDRLKELQKNRTELEISTRGQADNPLWQATRRKILTASNFGKVCRMRDTTSCSATVTSILYPTVKSTPAMVWGRTNEARAIEDLEKKLAGEGNPVTVRPCGLFIDPDFEFLGASPNGIIDDTTIVEVKCPKSAQAYHPVDAIELGVTEIPKFFDKNDTTTMNKSHHYYYQVQGQLHITRADFCYFVVWSPLGLKYVKVQRDDKFWSQQMEPFLTRFYKECLLPEIVDPRHTRHMPIREPNYVLEARNLRSHAVETSETVGQTTSATVGSHPDRRQEVDSDESSLCEVRGTIVDSGVARKTGESQKVGLMKLCRTDSEDPDSWCVTSTDEESRFPTNGSRVMPLKLLKRTSEDGVTWVVSSDETNKARIPPLKLQRTSERNSSWVVSSSDDQDLAHPTVNQKSRDTPPFASTTQSLAREERDTGNPWVVITDDRVTESPTQMEIDILESINQHVKIDDIARDVLSRGSLLNDTSIDQFLSVVKETSPFNTATSLWLVHQRFIKPSRTLQDIHIIGGNAFRHWRCIYFDGTQLFVYDSLGCYNYESLTQEEKRFITLRYPNLMIEDIAFPAVQKQPDTFSCGVFAAAFATTVALGENPSHVAYSKDVMKMRNHLFRIIESRKLSAFPID